MKFAKYLQEEVVPEWRKAYINYKQGKKYLKSIEAAIDNFETANTDNAEDDDTRALRLTEDDIPALKLTEDNTPTIRLTVDPRHPNDSNSTSNKNNNKSRNVFGGPTTSEPENDYPERPAAVYSPQLDFPTGTTPIITQERGHVRNYDTIQLPSHSAAAFNASETSFAGLEDDQAERSPTLRGRPSILPQQQRQQQEQRLGLRPAGATPTRHNSMAQQLNDTRTQGSQMFRTLTRRFTTASPPERSKRSRVIHLEGNSIDSVMDQLLDEEKEFFKFLDAQLIMVDTFYREKELEAATKLKVLKQQLYVADEWKRRYDDESARAQADRGWYQAEWSRMRSELGNLMSDSTVTEDVTLGPAHPQNQKHIATSVGAEPSGSSTAANPDANMRTTAEQDLRQRRPPVDQIAYQNQMVLDDEENRRQHLNDKVARSRIKAALYEFYRSLEMLKNYKVLNNTGFVKIMKKFDKTAGWKASKAFTASKLKPTYFMSSNILDDLFTETEDLFIEKFEKGQRRRGMAKLRIPDVKNQSHHAATVRIGIYIGLAIPLLILGLQSVLSQDTQAEIPYWDSLLLIYAGLFLTVLFSCLFGINMYVWAKSRINYKFIFEFDPRDNLDYHEFFELPVFCMLVLCVAFYLDFGTPLTRYFATLYWPLIAMATILAVMFCPFPIANWGARKWFLQSFGRLLVSGLFPVEFRDFFLADELNSLAYSIEQFEFAMCAYTQDWDNIVQACTTSKLWLTPFITSLPAWFRFMQCLRRYRDTLEWSPHLINSGKYFATLVQLFVYFTFRHYGGSRLKALYIVISLFTSAYTYSWDVYMDWGLFRFGKHGGGAYGHPFLRPELVYQKQWVYYLAIVLDFFGRFAWLVRLIPMKLNVLVLSFILATVEVLRRWMWNFFRLENEHLNNCGQFRAIKDIPLPFHIRVESLSDEEEGEEEEEEAPEDDNQVLEDGAKASAVQFSGEEAMAEGSGSDPQTAALHAANQIHKHSLARTTSTHSSKLGQSHRLGSGGPGGESRTSLHSAAPSQGGSNRPGLRRLTSQSSERLLNMQRSNTFVDNAMTEAGFDDNRREHLTAINKFYDHRDFDAKIVDGPAQGLFRIRTRSNTMTHGLGIDLQAGASGADGAGKSKVKRRKSMFGWNKGTDEEDTDEDDDA